MSKSLEKIRKIICDEIDAIAEDGKLSNAGALDTVDKLTHSLKSIETIMAMENGYSNDPYPKHYDHYYDQRYRDYDSRYSRDGMIDKLHSMLKDASTERERTAIKECIDKMER